MFHWSLLSKTEVVGFGLLTQNNTTSGAADDLRMSYPPAECPRLVILERWR